MAVTLASGLRAFCIAVSLMLATVRAADPVSPLIGATRDQVLSRYGEPKSQIEAGSRVVFFYAREKIILRDNVVVEVESLFGEPTTPRDSTGAPQNASATAGASAKANERGSAARSTSPAVPATSTSDARVEIKMVKSPSTKDGRATATEPVPSSPVTRSPVTPVSPAPQNVNGGSAAPMSPSPSVVSVDPVTRPTVKAPEPSNVVVPTEAKISDVAVKEKKEPVAIAPPPTAVTPPAVEADGMFGTRLFLILALIVVGGIALLYWRHRQRQFVLAATSVVNTPLASAPPPAFTGNGFTADELSKLEWKRFEELVIAYYSKTGVVAARTKTGPDSPVHIKISWKGEPRPFAYVQCIAQPSGLVDLKPLQSLVGALEADNIRRGYIVTSGKFNVQARNFAEEKHLTLLSAEVFLEKLNALPTAARTEIAQSIGAKESTVT